MNTTRRFGINTFLMFSSQIISLILAFIYGVYIARYLGATGFGLLSFALALISILGIFADLGLNTLMTREIAKDKALTKKYVNNIISIKIVLISLIIISIFLIVSILHYPQQTTDVIYLVTLSLIFSTFTSMFYSIFQAYEKLQYTSLGSILNSLLMLIGVLIIIHYNQSIILISFLYLLVAIILSIYTLIVSTKKFLLPKIGLNWKFSKDTIKLALEFGLITVFANVYIWIDTLMLFFIQGEQAVGLYNAAYRLVLVLSFIPGAINTAIFPVMSRLYGNSSNSLKIIVEKYFKLMLLIGIPIGIGGTLLSNKIILVIFGTGYINSVPALQILIWTTVFVFIGSSFLQLLQSINRQLVVTKITSICMLENIVLNLLLIPTYSFIGASIATVITEFTVTILLIIVTSKTKYIIQKRKILVDLIKISISSFIMALFILIFIDLNLFLIIFLSTIIYFTSLYLTRTFDKDDKKIIYNMIS